MVVRSGSVRCRWWGHRLSLALCVPCVVSAGCGGESKSATCGGGAACGGDIEGTWRVTKLCAELDPGALPALDGLPAACTEGLRADLGRARVTPVDASIAFAGGQYRQSGTMRFEADVRYTDGCLAALGAAPASPAACTSFESSLRSTLESGTCKAQPGACACSIAGVVPFRSVGQYRTDGVRLFLDGESQGGGYCVRTETAAVQATTGGVRGTLELERTGPASGAGGGSSADGGPGAGGWSGAGGSAGAGGAGGSVSAGGADAGGVVAEGVELARGASRLVDAFVAAPGIYVVLEDALVLVDRQGVEIRRIAAPRPVTAAAFDGTRLVVADGARFTTYGLDLVETAAGNLVEACASAVLLDDGRFVCGPANDWDRIFYTYDAGTGEPLASSSPYTYNGIPMQRVPGSNEFVTVTVGTSPSDFHLYSTSGAGEATYVGESPYHGDFPVTAVYAWNAVPATHLVTHTGLLLLIHGANCSPGVSSFDSGCFTRDGALGTLTGQQQFVAMDTDRNGKVHGVVAASGGFRAECPESCVLQRVDVASRTIEVQKVTRFGAGTFVALRHDATSGAVVAAYHLPGQAFPNDPYPGHRVASFSED